MTPIIVEDRDHERLAEELAALGKAWCDRGVSPVKVLEIFFLIGIKGLCEARLPMRVVVDQIMKTWSDLGGRA